MFKYVLWKIHQLFTAITGILYYSRSNGQSLMITSSGYVVTSDGKSKDALPIMLVSQEVVDLLEKHLIAWGYPQSQEA